MTVTASAVSSAHRTDPGAANGWRRWVCWPNLRAGRGPQRTRERSVAVGTFTASRVQGSPGETETSAPRRHRSIPTRVAGAVPAVPGAQLNWRVERVPVAHGPHATERIGGDRASRAEADHTGRVG